MDAEQLLAADALAELERCAALTIADIRATAADARAQADELERTGNRLQRRRARALRHRFDDFERWGVRRVIALHKKILADGGISEGGITFTAVQMEAAGRLKAIFS